METSMISGKAISLMQNENHKMTTSFFDVNPLQTHQSTNNKTRHRYETPDNAKDTYEHLFLKRLQFLKSLLKEDDKLNSLSKDHNVSELYKRSQMTPRVGKSFRLNDISQYDSKYDSTIDKENDFKLNTNSIMNDKSIDKDSTMFETTRSNFFRKEKSRKNDE